MSFFCQGKNIQFQYVNKQKWLWYEISVFAVNYAEAATQLLF